jgi:putative endonuclease
MHKRAKGQIGEDIACKFLEKQGFTIIERNFLRKWGELDIIGRKEGILHFFEVKSVTFDFSWAADIHRPEDNVHGLKVKRLRRIIETYLGARGLRLDLEIQFHILCVFMDMNTRRARVKWIKNVILC